MEGLQEIRIDEGISVIEQISKSQNVVTYFSNGEFNFIFSERDLSLISIRDKVSACVANNMFEFKKGSILKCNIHHNLSFTKIEFVMAGNFKVCFEYQEEDTSIRRTDRCVSLGLM